jgi:hypothetical protein
VAAGRTPNTQASGRVTLPLTGRRYAVLSSGGKETPQGAFYKTLVGEGQGLGGLGGDRIVRPNGGNRKYLQTRARKTLLRSIDESNGQWVYTKAGLKYFRTNSLSEFVVYIPVEIKSLDGRQRGRKRTDWLPWSKFGSNVLQSQLGTPAERRAQVVWQVKEGLGVEGQGDVVMEVSGEVYRSNEGEAEWNLTEMGTPAMEHGVPQTTITNTSFQAPPPREEPSQPRRSQLDVPLGHRGRARSFLPFPDELLLEVFEQRDDRCCFPRQLC